MICKACHEFFAPKRRFFELLKSKKSYICDSCLKKIKLDLTEEVLPLSKHRLIIFHLYDMFDLKYIDYLAFEYSKIYNKLTKINDIVIIVDEFKIDMINIYDYISILLDSDIYILSFK